jgi:hypothetical protein
MAKVHLWVCHCALSKSSLTATWACTHGVDVLGMLLGVGNHFKTSCGSETSLSMNGRKLTVLLRLHNYRNSSRLVLLSHFVTVSLRVELQVVISDGLSWLGSGHPCGHGLRMLNLLWCHVLLDILKWLHHGLASYWVLNHNHLRLATGRILVIVHWLLLRHLLHDGLLHHLLLHLGQVCLLLPFLRGTIVFLQLLALWKKIVHFGF